MEIRSHTLGAMALEPKDAGLDHRKAELEQAAQGFEALFLREMLKAGRAASLGEGLGQSSAVETTQSMFDGALAEQGATRSAFGLTQAIVAQFAPLLSAASKPGARDV